MWNDLLIAIALVMVIEGVFPFISPKGWRNMMLAVSQMDDRSLRTTGLISMALGVAMLYLVN